MILVNEITAAEAAIDAGQVSASTVAEVLRGLIQMLAPFAPFFAAELWETIGNEGAIFRTPWPVADEALAKESEIEIPVQINGKLVTVIKVPADSDQANRQIRRPRRRKGPHPHHRQNHRQDHHSPGQTSQPRSEVTEQIRHPERSSSAPSTSAVEGSRSGPHHLYRSALSNPNRALAFCF